MARRKSKGDKPTTSAAAENKVAAAERPALISLEELRQKADELVAAQDWDALLALGKTPPSVVREDSRSAAELPLLLVQVRALTKDRMGLPPGATHDLKNELRDITLAIAKRDERFFGRPEFGVFVDCLGYGFEDCYVGFKVLLRACSAHADLHWVSRLRGCGIRLLDPFRFFEDITEEQRQLIDGLPEVDVALSEAFARLEGAEDASATDRLLAKVFRLELATRMADPWDYERVAQAIRGLPTPTMAAVQAAFPDEDSATNGRHLLPCAWAFLWELSQCTAEGLPQLLQRYDGAELGNVAFEGLRDIAKSLVVTEGRESALLSGVGQLTEALQGWTGWLGDSITLDLADGPTQLPLSFGSLEVPLVADVLTHLSELAPVSFARRSALSAFARVYAANEDLNCLGDDQWSDKDLPGLEWLCEHNVGLQFAAAYALPGGASRLGLFVRAIRRCAERAMDPPNYYSAEQATGEMTLNDVHQLQHELTALAKLRGSMSERLVKTWRQEVGHIFSALSKPEGASRKKTLELARIFAEDLLDARQAFRLGYLEQVEGDREQALHWYLVELADVKEASDALLNNMKLLWNGCEDHGVVEALVARLEEQSPGEPHAQVLAMLIANAKAREAVLERQAQFERTAVNRWPTLTAPARKLLGVLDNINHYNGFAELGEYAGMPVEWAERHYRKLVELGMVVETKTGYRINSYVKPLLDREGQHSVIGRIVRAQGTSAVKQVFNSQREYSIYQVMVQLCPNHLVFPNCALQSVMSFDRMKELVEDSDFGYYLRASVDLVVVSSTTFLPMLAIEVDSVWHDTDKQQERDDRKDRLFAVAGIPFMRLRPVGSPSEDVIRGQVAEHLDELVRSLRTDIPGYDQARKLLEDLSA